jgi:hypothetical protein
MVVISLAAAAGFRAARRPLCRVDRDQARRENRKPGWPCRELNRQPTLKFRSRGSRFGESGFVAVQKRFVMPPSFHLD